MTTYENTLAGYLRWRSDAHDHAYGPALKASKDIPDGWNTSPEHPLHDWPNSDARHAAFKAEYARLIAEFAATHPEPTASH